ncbi:hypothetical protein PF008_g19882 [Phytophthora fragariae]|uniref:Uncharacterized protein n=1 Tax=Phytophthora fragariae TaxID=53985 RepID=A0A6G0R1C7_9STRA|nr:hypothetical protein PF008_g19882 [Phytophthora fragariae]
MHWHFQLAPVQLLFTGFFEDVFFKSSCPSSFAHRASPDTSICVTQGRKTMYTCSVN